MMTGGFDKVLRLFDLERPDAAPTTLEGCSSRITKAEYLGADEMTVVTGEDEGKDNAEGNAKGNAKRLAEGLDDRPLEDLGRSRPQTERPAPPASAPRSRG